MFGGNSNWRGPIWMPVNMMLVRALINYYQYYGNDFLIECPTGSGNKNESLSGCRGDFAAASSIFLNDKSGHRPVFGNIQEFQEDRDGAIISFSTNISMATPVQTSVRATRPDGQAL